MTAPTYAMLGPKLAFDDENGEPGVGFLLWVYLTGSAIPKTTYSDSGLTAAHTNPLVADARGEVGPIYWDGAALKLVLETAPAAGQTHGTTVWTVDPVSDPGMQVQADRDEDAAAALLLETTGTAAPTTGTWALGAKVWNSAPTGSSYAGWICTVAGTPGTWRGFGWIEASTSPSVSPSVSTSSSPSLSTSSSPSVSVSPSTSESSSASVSPSATPSASASLSPSRSMSYSESASPSLSPSLSASDSPSLSESSSPSVSPSASA